MKENAAQNILLNRTKIKIIEAAEKLFAEKGIDNVSTREIAREAGQKNHSAMHYHFGSMDQLVKAIYDHRMIPVDELRKSLFEEELKKTDNLELRDLIYILIAPAVEVSLDEKRESYFLKILAQFLSRTEWRAQYLSHENRLPNTANIGRLIYKKLSLSQGERIAFERLKMMGATILITIAEWNFASQDKAFEKDRHSMTLFKENNTEIPLSREEKIQNLLDFLMGAITETSSIKSNIKPRLKKT